MIFLRKMKYENTNTEKQKSDIKNLEEIAIKKGYSSNLLRFKLEEDYTIGDFLAETIEIVNNPNISLEKHNQEIMKDIDMANNKNKEKPGYASIRYRNAGQKSLALSGKFQDKRYSDLIKKCFLYASKCEEKIKNNRSKEYKMISDNIPIFQEMLFDYFNHEKKIDSLIKKTDENEITLPYFLYHPLDWIDIINKYAEENKDINSKEMQNRILTEYVLCGINHIRDYKKQGLDVNSKKVQQTTKEVYTNSKFLELDQSKIKSAIENIF